MLESAWGGLNEMRKAQRELLSSCIYYYFELPGVIQLVEEII